MDAALRIDAIGRCAAFAGASRIDPAGGPLLAATLLFGLEPERKHTRREVEELLWPHAATEMRHASLVALLEDLRHAGIAVESDDRHVWIPSENVSSDVDRLDASVVERAGAILLGYEPDISPGFTAWLDETRTRIHAKVLHHLLTTLGAASRTGDWCLTASLAHAVRRMDPTNEEGCLRLAEALCRLGERTRGLDVLAEYSQLIGHRPPDRRRQATSLEQRLRASDPSAFRLEPRFVGRSEELKSLDSLLASARTEAGSGITLLGPAGIGKTRLLDELALRGSMTGMQVIRLSAQRGDMMRPLSIVADLAGALLGLPGSLSCAADHLEHLYNISRGDAAGEAADERLESPALLRQRVGDALLGAIASITREAPVLIQIDDAQWLDESAVRVFQAIVPMSAKHRVAWMFAMRRAQRGKIDLKLPHLVLSSLDRAAASTLLADLIARHDAPASIDRAALLARGGGSPLFLRELVRHCAATGTADGVPTTLAALLETGTSSLSRYALRVLQAAGILGTYATLNRIEAVARIARGRMLEAIAELEGAAILSVDALGATTTHALWVGAAIARLKSDAAVLLHQRAAEQFESELIHSTSGALLWECARHWSAAGNVERARQATLTGIALLDGTGFTSDAAAACARAIRWTTDPEERLELLDRRIRLLYEAAEWKELDEVVDEYDALRMELDPSYDGHSDHEIRRWRADHYRTGDVRGWIIKALACARSETATISHRLFAARECALAAESESLPSLILVHDLASSLPAKTPGERWDKTLIELAFERRCGSPLRALALSDQLVDIADVHPDRKKATVALGHRALSLSLAGRTDEAKGVYLERIVRAKSLGQWLEATVAFDELIGLMLDLESVAMAEQTLAEMERFVGASAEANTPMQRLVIRAHTGQLLVMKGQFVEADAVAFSNEEIAQLHGRTRTRLLAVRLAIARALGRAGEAVHLGTLMSRAFVAPDYWLDWPASVFARYLRDSQASDDAAAFAQDFVRRVRRESYPPPRILADLAASAATMRPVA